MKTLICGGRHYNDYEAFARAMTRAVEKHDIDFVISGSSRSPAAIGMQYNKLRGVDDIALCWANRIGIPSKNFSAEWGKYKNAAGPIRNQQMLDEGSPDIVLVFPGGTGTNDMCMRSKNARYPVMVLRGEAWVLMSGETT